MKIMYLIYRPNVTVGGHVYSLRTIARAIQTKVPVVVVSLGIRSAALDDGSLPYHNLEYSRWNLPGALRKLSGLIREERPDVLHTFDDVAHFFGHLVAWWQGKGLLHTKCGGPNPGRFFSRTEEMILFSRENVDFFKSSPMFRNTRLHFIPNRVTEVPQDYVKIRELRSRIDSQEHVVLRIGRIAAEYEATTLQGINLVKRLRSTKIAIRFVQIGNVQSEGSLNRLQAALGSDDYIHTEKRFTLNASECIEAGDFALGTGRSLMEAASRSRLLLVPVKDAELPVLVTPENWEVLAASNFSGRASLPSELHRKSIEAVQQVLANSALMAQFTEFGRHMYERHFSLESKLGEYLNIYEGLGLKQRPNPVEALVQGLRVFRKGTPTRGLRRSK